MKISKVAQILGAKVLCGEKKLGEIEVDYAFGADLMSDALAFVRGSTLFLTGMVNQHTLRTADVLDIHCIVFVRGKEVPHEIIDMADELEIVLLYTEKTLFTCCGLLYEAGLRSVARD
jgi:predicted transcriptional regulator